MTTTDTPTPTRVTTKNKVGLVLAGLLGLANLTSPLLPGGDSGDPDTAGPPMGVLIVGAVIAVVTLVAVVHNWVTGKR
ncbi:MAG TPA: hypothetical protein VHA75_10055, partial [Rugosimonospora sp.]|nr:hypothetical protein [Rugosimonospora sp.]